MTIEINKAQSAYIYRVDPKNKLNIERRKNVHGARWCFFMTTDSPNEAKRILLKLALEGDE